MESSDNPGIKPPDPNDKKKADGSFVKRNIWLVVVSAGVLLIGGVTWFIYSEIKTLSRTGFQKVSLKKPDSVDDDEDFNPDSGSKVDTANAHDSVFIKPYSRDIKSVKLNITADAVNIALPGIPSDRLLETECWENHSRYKFESHKNGSTTVMDIKGENTLHSKSFTGHIDSINLKLSDQPEWQIALKAGAAHIDLDLSKFKVRSVKLNGGAGAYVLKLGQPLSVTNISVSTGASEITIEIPKDAACHIHLNTSLSASTFDGFRKKRENEYETQGFDKAKNKIFIDFEGAISDYQVDRY